MKRTLILILGLLAGCARVHQPPAPAAGSADAEFAKMAADYISGYLAWRPQNGTAVGLHEYDGKLTDYSQPSLGAELARLKAFDEQLSRLDISALSSAASFDSRILQGAIRREIFAFEQAQIYSQNPMTYAGAIDVNIYIKRNFAPLEERVRSLTAILKQEPKVMAAARANLADSLPRPEIETAIDQANGAVDFLGKDLVTALKDVKDEKVMAEFRDANSAAIEELRGFASWLKDRKLPKANANYALGREKYRKLLEYGEMVTLSPEELLEIGQRELAKKQQVFADAAKVIDPTRTPVEVFKEIQRDHPSEESLIPETAKDLEMIRQFDVSQKLVAIPSPVRANVKETPQYLRATSFASMDTPGPFETKATEAYYYVTPPEPDWTAKQKEEWLTAFNYYTTDIVSIHEAYPGHYVQFLCLNASPATKLEKMFTSYAFVEGWAHYCEQMMVDEGFGKAAPRHGASAGDDRIKAAKYLMAQTDEALLRLCRFCVSIKMHCQGLTVEQATKFFQDNCYYEEKSAHSEAVRGSYDPEYLYYTLGKMEILKLRDDFRKQEGSSFSLEKFHAQLLSHGGPPIRLLRELMLKDRANWGSVL